MMKNLRILVALSTILFPGAALAQSSPGLIQGQVPTPAQWNSYFAAKQDVLGFTPVNRAGDVMTGRLVTSASTAARAGFNIPHGAAPTSPVNGDVWTTTAGVFARINGATVGPFGASGVSSVSNSDGTLTISPTTGDAIASLNLSHANTWAASQTFSAAIVYGGVTLSNAVTGTGPMVLGTAPTISGGTAAGLGKVAPWYGGYVAGRYYVPIVGTLNTLAISANVVYFQSFYVGETHTFDRIAFEVSATGTATLCRYAIYNAAGGQPTSLVLDAGTSAGVTGTGLGTVTISQSLAPGIYWNAIVCNGTATLVATLSSLAAYNGTTTTFSAAPNSQLTATLTFGAFPATAFTGGMGAATYTNAFTVIIGYRG